MLGKLFYGSGWNVFKAYTNLVKRGGSCILLHYKHMVLEGKHLIMEKHNEKEPVASNGQLLLTNSRYIPK